LNKHGQHVDGIDLPHLLEDAPGILSLGELTPHVEHAFDDGADEGGLAQDDKLEAIARDEGDVLAGLWKVHADGCPEMLPVVVMWKEKKEEAPCRRICERSAFTRTRLDESRAR
jgi:hypothetical protein